MIRYRKLGRVELNVTDLDKSRRFYEDMVGLQFVGRGGEGELLFRCCEDRYSVVLHPSETGGYKRSAWALESEREFDPLYRALDGAGTPWEDLSKDECRAREFARASRMVEPNTGATLEFYLPAAGLEGHSFTPTLAKIQRLGHVVFSTPKFDEACRYFLDVLNFRASDRVGDVVLLMRPFASPYHHGAGLARSKKFNFHHLNFMVSEIDDIGAALHRLRKHDVPIVYGPGRHPASGSVFLYYLEPDQMTLEYSFGMEQFPEVQAREARTFPLVPESSDSWGAPLDPRMAQTGVIEPYSVARA